MDEVDIALLDHLRQDSRIPYRELARSLGLSVTSVHKRIKVMIEDQVIKAFRTVLNPRMFDALQVVVFGHAGVRDLGGAVSTIGKSKFTSEVSIAGGNDLYVTGLLEDLSDLDDYAWFVKKTAKMPEAVTGIVQHMGKVDVDDMALTQLDYRIVQSLHKDSRRPFSEVAEELGVTPRTVHRRFERMVDHGVILRSLQLLPECTNDIIAIFRVHLKKGAKVKQVYSRLVNAHSPNLLSIVAFSDIQDTILCTIWCSTMNEVRTLQRALSKEAPIGSAVLNMVHSTYVFDTWMDTVLVQMAKAPDTERSRGKFGKGGSKPKVRLDIGTISELETYRRALVQALEDGVITEDEEAILRSLRDTLKISESEHNTIFEAICSKRQRDLKQIETYRRALVQALEDGVITEDEEAILRSLRDTLMISDHDHERLLRSMKGADKGSQRATKGKGR